MHKFLTTDIGNIAYKSYNFSGRTVMFCGGYGSNMLGYKVTKIEQFCIFNNISFVKFDYIGHGSSSGVFLECNLSIWLESAKIVLKTIKEKEIVLIGSSMGGWIALLLALMFPERIKALIGIAPAPDFTEDMFASMNDEEKKMLLVGNLVKVCKPTHSYFVTKNLIFDGKKYLLLNSSPINIDIPISLFHSMDDDIVDYKKSLMLTEKLKSSNVELTLIKHSDHSMNSNIELFLSSIMRYTKNHLAP